MSSFKCMKGSHIYVKNPQIAVECSCYYEQPRILTTNDVQLVKVSSLSDSPPVWFISLVSAEPRRCTDTVA